MRDVYKRCALAVIAPIIFAVVFIGTIFVLSNNTTTMSGKSGTVIDYTYQPDRPTPDNTSEPAIDAQYESENSATDKTQPSINQPDNQPTQAAQPQDTPQVAGVAYETCGPYWGSISIGGYNHNIYISTDTNCTPTDQVAYWKFDGSEVPSLDRKGISLYAHNYPTVFELIKTERYFTLCEGGRCKNFQIISSEVLPVRDSMTSFHDPYGKVGLRNGKTAIALMTCHGANAEYRWISYAVEI